jgi:hypothetical protein
MEVMKVPIALTLSQIYVLDFIVVVVAVVVDILTMMMRRKQLDH